MTPFFKEIDVSDIYLVLYVQFTSVLKSEIKNKNEIEKKKIIIFKNNKLIACILDSELSVKCSKGLKWKPGSLNVKYFLWRAVLINWSVCGKKQDGLCVKTRWDWIVKRNRSRTEVNISINVILIHSLPQRHH